MIKFEVGKVYKRLDLTVTVFKVYARTDKNLIIRMDYSGNGQDFEEAEHMYKIIMLDDVEVLKNFCINDEQLIARADEEFYPESKEDEKEPETNIEEVKQEDKEEDIESDEWVVDKEYEAVCLETQQRFKVKLIHYDEDSCYLLTFNSTNTKSEFPEIFENYKNIAFAEICGEECDKTVVIFKHGIKSILDWEEAKEKPREPVHFRVGNTYKGFNDEMFVCQTTFITTNSEKVGVFYNSKKDAILAQKIYSKNNVEYTYFMKTDQLDFIADEQYRDEIKALL
ncbi:hypothetical protein [Succinatimonas hippei]|uniref:hypothetical protein n=1 Tax=Succinatimonas hippei TaxID=626938 RepID=UPI002492C916|nr:hypothetical protein [Succinatimonas hippei]